jgi:hypothetical protein
MIRGLEITPAEQRAAIDLLARRRERDPAARLNEMAWDTVRRAGLLGAVDRARSAQALVSWSPEYLGMRGIAEYRTGQLDTALATLSRSADAWASHGEAWVGPISLPIAIRVLDENEFMPVGAENLSADFALEGGRFVFTGPFKEILASAGIVRAFRAMCLQKLGRTAEARADVEWVRLRSRTEAQQIRKAGRKSWNNATIAGFLDEADAMVTDAESRRESDPAAFKQARARVNLLFADPKLFGEDVIERLEADRTLPAGLRETALRTAKDIVDGAQLGELGRGHTNQREPRPVPKGRPAGGAVPAPPAQ